MFETTLKAMLSMIFIMVAGTSYIAFGAWILDIVSHSRDSWLIPVVSVGWFLGIVLVAILITIGRK